MNHIFDQLYNGLPEQYRAELTPDLYPGIRLARVENWPREDRESYCGIYE